MQIDRRAACGSPDPDEPLNKSQVYVNFFSISVAIKKLIEKKPIELRGSLEQVIRSEAWKQERSTTISKESTLQAFGNGSGGPLLVIKRVKIQSTLHRDMQQFIRERIWCSEPYRIKRNNSWLEEFLPLLEAHRATSSYGHRAREGVRNRWNLAHTRSSWITEPLFY